MASIGDLFKSGSIGEQLLVWGLLNQVINAAITPGVVEITQQVQGAAPLVVLSPADLANAVVRGFMALGDAAGEATQSGISNDRFTQLVNLAGNSIGPQEAVSAFYRGIIGESGLGADSTSLQAAISEGDLKDKWQPVLEQLGIDWPTNDEVVQAYVQAQISLGEAQTRYKQGAGDMTWWDTAVGLAGNSPSPVEAGSMANRGLIPWDGLGADVTSFEQAIHEGDWKNKWIPAWRGYATYRPPVRTVTALLRAGSITQAEALAQYQANGLTAADAAAEVRNAMPHATAAVKALTEAQVTSLYEAKLVTKPVAQAQLVALGYPAASAEYLLELADLKAAASATQSAVTRIQALFTGGKEDATQATAALSKLGLDDGQISELLAVWELETSSTVSLLSVSQWGQAFQYAIIDQPTVTQGLMSLGYDAVDAYLIASIYAKGPLPDPPAGTPTPPPAAT